MIHLVDRRIKIPGYFIYRSIHLLDKRSEVTSISLYSNMYRNQVVFVNIIIQLAVINL